MSTTIDPVLLSPGLADGDGDTIWRIGLDQAASVARANAEAVDREARFPVEAMATMREHGMLAALIPRASNGLGQSLRSVAGACHVLGGCCASTAMVFAMHQIQVACLVDHAMDPGWLRNLLERVRPDGLLLASVTSEVGIGGNMRNSLCAVEIADGSRFVLVKQASAISYGAHADVVLATARANPSADRADQVLVVVPVADGVLERNGNWNTMGMRGTCSEAFTLRAEGGAEQIVPVPFAQIAAQSMVPVSHLLWCSLWCGVAADAVRRARMFLRNKMIRGVGEPASVPEGAGRLVRAVEQLQCLEARVKLALQDHDAMGQARSFGEIAAVSTLKTAVSEGCLAVVEEALMVCGFAGYSNEGPFSLSRHLRDLHSARLMIHNDRIRDSTARLLILQAPALGVT